MKRFSYQQKNAILAQIKLINKLLPHFNINGLSDYTTEIDSNVKFNLDKINEHIDEVKQHFKISEMGLAKHNYKISTGSQAITLLKHMCRQANVTYDLIKHPNKYSFALAPPNIILQEYLKNSGNAPKPVHLEFSKDKQRLLSLQQILKRPISSNLTNSYSLLLPTTFPKTHPLVELSTGVQLNNLDQVFSESIKDDSKDVDTTYHSTHHIGYTYIRHGTRYFNLKLVRNFDVIYDVEIKIYDTHGNEVNATLEGFNVSRYSNPVPLTVLSPDCQIEGNSVKNLNLPIVALPFYEINLKFSTEYNDTMICYTRQRSRFCQQSTRGKIGGQEFEERIKTIQADQSFDVQVESYWNQCTVCSGTLGKYMFTTNPQNPVTLSYSNAVIGKLSTLSFDMASLYYCVLAESEYKPFTFRLSYNIYKDIDERRKGLKFMKTYIPELKDEEHLIEI